MIKRVVALPQDRNHISVDFDGFTEIDVIVAACTTQEKPGTAAIDIIGVVAGTQDNTGMMARERRRSEVHGIRSLSAANAEIITDKTVVINFIVAMAEHQADVTMRMDTFPYRHDVRIEATSHVQVIVYIGINSNLVSAMTHNRGQYTCFGCLIDIQGVCPRGHPGSGLDSKKH